MRGTLLVKNVKHLVTCDANDRLLDGVDVFIRDGVIEAIGPVEETAEDVIDASNMVMYPGLINTHHHLYQTFSRNLPQVQNMELFPWLKTLYEIWKHVDEDVVYYSSLTGMGELLKTGCTTCLDHHYVFPKDTGMSLLDAQFGAADALGMRFHATRGSMDLSVKDGGLPPDTVVQTVDEILKDSEEAVKKYHDSSRYSMHQVALAPCSPFSVTGELLRESAVLARKLKVRLHTHLAETKDEEQFTLSHFGMRPLAYMESLGWIGPDVWYAHGIHFNDEELNLLAGTGTGFAMCLLPFFFAFLFRDIGKTLAVPMVLFFLMIFLMNGDQALSISRMLPMGQLRLIALQQFTPSMAQFVLTDFLWIFILYFGAYWGFRRSDLK